MGTGRHPQLAATLVGADHLPETDAVGSSALLPARPAAPIAQAAHTANGAELAFAIGYPGARLVWVYGPGVE